MAQPTTFPGDLIASNGSVVTRSLILTTASITSSMLTATAGITPTQLQYLVFDLPYTVAIGTTIAAATGVLRIIRGQTAVVLAMQAAITGTIATGSDRTVTVDLQKSTAGGAFATILSSTIGFTHSSVLYTVGSATISSPNCVVTDILAVVITVAGSASAQALGLQVSVTLEETPS